MNDRRFMGKALELAREALADGEFPVGCILVYDGAVIVSGKRIGSRRNPPSEIAHAEMLALGQLEELDAGIDRSAVSLYCTLEPCLMCLGATVLSRIGRLVYAYEDVMGGAAACQIELLSPLYREHRLEIVPHVRRNRSLALFQAFFRHPDNAYWRDSLLCRYTLAQNGGRMHED